MQKKCIFNTVFCNTTIRSLYCHVVCNGPVSCKANRVGNQLGVWQYSDLLAIIYLLANGIAILQGRIMLSSDLAKGLKRVLNFCMRLFD